MSVPAACVATAILLILAWVFALLMQRRQNVAVLWLLCLLLVVLTVLVVLLSAHPLRLCTSMCGSSTARLMTMIPPGARLRRQSP